MMKTITKILAVAVMAIVPLLGFNFAQASDGHDVRTAWAGMYGSYYGYPFYGSYYNYPYFGSYYGYGNSYYSYPYYGGYWGW